MKSQVLHTVWCHISCEAAGEFWHWSLSGVKGLILSLPMSDQFQISPAASPELAFPFVTQIKDDYATNSHYISNIHVFVGSERVMKQRVSDIHVNIMVTTDIAFTNDKIVYGINFWPPYLPPKLCIWNLGKVRRCLVRDLSFESRDWRSFPTLLWCFLHPTLVQFVQQSRWGR